MKILLATDGSQIQVSDDDFVYLAQYSWLVIRSHDNHSAVVCLSTKGHEPMANLILKRRGIEFNDLIDHKDRNSFNNQIENLRPATYSQNSANQKVRCTNTSGYKGVSFESSRGKYSGYITVKGLKIHLGRFADPVQAAKAYDKAANRYFGEFAVLNFPNL